MTDDKTKGVTHEETSGVRDSDPRSGELCDLHGTDSRGNARGLALPLVPADSLVRGPYNASLSRAVAELLGVAAPRRPGEAAD